MTPRIRNHTQFARAVLWLARHRGEDTTRAVELTAHLFEVSTSDVRAAVERRRGARLDEMRKDTIIAARIDYEAANGMMHVYVSTATERDFELFAYYRDELRFTWSEFIGRTVAEARDLHRARDVAFLRDEVAAHG